MDVCEFETLPDGSYRCHRCGDTYAKFVVANCFPVGFDATSCRHRGRRVRVVLSKLCASKSESHNVFVCTNDQVAEDECAKSIRGRDKPSVAICLGCEFQEVKHDNSKPGPFGS